MEEDLKSVSSQTDGWPQPSPSPSLAWGGWWMSSVSRVVAEPCLPKTAAGGSPSPSGSRGCVEPLLPSKLRRRRLWGNLCPMSGTEQPGPRHVRPLEPPARQRGQPSVSWQRTGMPRGEHWPVLACPGDTGTGPFPGGPGQPPEVSCPAIQPSLGDLVASQGPLLS